MIASFQRKKVKLTADKYDDEDDNDFKGEEAKENTPVKKSV